MILILQTHFWDVPTWISSKCNHIHPLNIPSQVFPSQLPYLIIISSICSYIFLMPSFMQEASLTPLPASIHISTALLHPSLSQASISDSFLPVSLISKSLFFSPFCNHYLHIIFFFIFQKYTLHHGFIRKRVKNVCIIEWTYMGHNYSPVKKQNIACTSIFFKCLFLNC